MKNPCTVDIGSVTHAMKAQRALTAAAIYTEVIKTDIGRQGKGCVYGLAFPCPQARTARQENENPVLFCRKKFFSKSRKKVLDDQASFA